MPFFNLYDYRQQIVLYTIFIINADLIEFHSFFY